MRRMSGRGLRVGAECLLYVSSVCLVGDVDVEMVLVGKVWKLSSDVCRGLGLGSSPPRYIVSHRFPMAIWSVLDSLFIFQACLIFARYMQVNENAWT
jgi:hypothetical protein